MPTHICRLITKLHTHNTCKEHFQGSVGGRSLPQFHPKFRASWMKHMPRNILFHRLTSWNYQGNACCSRVPTHICRLITKFHTRNTCKEHFQGSAGGTLNPKFRASCLNGSGVELLKCILKCLPKARLLAHSWSMPGLVSSGLILLSGCLVAKHISRPATWLC